MFVYMYNVSRRSRSAWTLTASFVRFTKSAILADIKLQSSASLADTSGYNISVLRDLRDIHNRQMREINSNYDSKNRLSI